MFLSYLLGVLCGRMVEAEGRGQTFYMCQFVSSHKELRRGAACLSAVCSCSFLREGFLGLFGHPWGLP